MLIEIQSVHCILNEFGVLIDLHRLMYIDQGTACQSTNCIKNYILK